MTTEELLLVNEFKKQFKERFGQELHIDFPRMNGVPVTRRRRLTRRIFNFSEGMREFFDECLTKHGVTEEQVRATKLAGTWSKGNSERANLKKKICACLEEFYTFVAQKGLSYHEAARLTNRDRSVIYYYIT